MKILALDSTAKAGSAAVYADGETLAYFVNEAGRTHSEKLLPMALSALSAAGMTPEEVEAFAVTTGPGSFTGVRIGVATVKGLAFGRDVRCVGVSTLEALAENLVPLPDLYCPVMDARRGEVYNALFTLREGTLTRLCPDRAIPVEALAAELTAYAHAPIRLCGDGARQVYHALYDRLPVVLPPAALEAENAASVARCAARILLAGGGVSDRDLAPTYLRLPQAERERLEREKTTQKGEQI